MAHGFAGIKDHSLKRFAKAFCNAGFIVVVHDRQRPGSSGLALRQSRTRPILGFKKWFRFARIVLNGIELMHMINNGQMKTTDSNELPPSNFTR
jgi:alpha-beta hydrolase superfamily lysophospholipase